MTNPHEQPKKLPPIPEILKGVREEQRILQELQGTKDQVDTLLSNEKLMKALAKNREKFPGVDINYLASHLFKNDPEWLFQNWVLLTKIHHQLRAAKSLNARPIYEYMELWSAVSEAYLREHPTFNLDARLHQYSWEPTLKSAQKNLEKMCGLGLGSGEIQDLLRVVNNEIIESN